MFLKKGQLPILIVNLLMVIGFGILYFSKKNYEFVMYIAVIILFFILILATNKKHNLSNGVLWGLTIWAFMHMAGGSLLHNGAIWYKWQLIEIVNNPDFFILRYDQLVHFIGFGIATLIGYQLLNPYLNKKVNWKVLSVLIVLLGMGIGALNEIIEFLAVVIIPETGVGGYYNTMLDIVFNTLGAICAVIWINFKRLRGKSL